MHRLAFIEWCVGFLKALPLVSPDLNFEHLLDMYLHTVDEGGAGS